MKVTTIGVDLAKSVFQVHGVDGSGRPTVQRRLRRKQVLPFFARVPPCLVGMEACGGAHYWARELQKLGHTVRLMAPQFVKPYVKANKTDAADAEAICEAVTRPTMRFVPIKSIDQHGVLSLHRARAGFVKSRTAQANQIRGLLGEFGITIPSGIGHVAKRIPEIVEDAENELPVMFRDLLLRLRSHLLDLDRQVQALDEQITAWHRTNEDSQRLAQIPGVGVLTASALVASVGDAKCFKNGRELAAWLGLVPRQHSSGGKPLLLGISKRGDTYLRTLLVHGARSVVRISKNKQTPTDSWTNDVSARRHMNVVCVARANKNVRIAWALLVHQRCYDGEHQLAA
jgi:transposase